MNKNLFFQELKLYKKTFLVWLILLNALLIMGISVYHFIVRDNFLEVFSQMLDGPMGDFLKMFNVSKSTLQNILTFFITYYTFYALLPGGILAIWLGHNLIAKEEYEKTADFLFSKPLNRDEIIISKIAVYFALVFVLNIAFMLCGFVAMEIFKDGPYNTKAFFILSFYSFLMMLSFGAIGIFIGVIMKRGKPIIGATIGTVFALFMIDMITRTIPAISNLGYISPFKFVNTDTLQIIAGTYSLDWWRLLYFAILTVAFNISAIMLFKKKDILV